MMIRIGRKIAFTIPEDQRRDERADDPCDVDPDGKIGDRDQRDRVDDEPNQETHAGLVRREPPDRRPARWSGTVRGSG